MRSIMGQPTFGKGSVQTVVDLTPEVGMKLTIARYYYAERQKHPGQGRAARYPSG